MTRRKTKKKVFHVSLNPDDVLSAKALKSRIGEKEFGRFSALIEGGCMPLHIPSRSLSKAKVSVCGFKQWPEPEKARPFTHLHLPEEVKMQAQAIVKAENELLRKSKTPGSWIDGEKLAVRKISYNRDGVQMSVSGLWWSEILAMKSMSFPELADLGAFKLDTNTHVLAKEKRHTLLLVGHRGRKPGDPRMGAEAMLAPAKPGTQWTLATNGTLDADVLRSSDETDAWIKNSMSEFEQELGVEGKYLLKYLGLMVDTRMFTGAIGIVGSIHTNLTPDQIDEARSRARDGVEVSALDVIPLEKEALARYLRKNRDNMVPQLITGIVLLGYKRWGQDFLALADR
jgi:hypothetical protein